MNDPGELRALLAEVSGAGGCAHPVRLAGSTLDVATGEFWEGAVPVACKDRRAAVCPACAERYRADAWHLVAAGLRGGKGVPEEVAQHPCLFVTLTAPSFGPVHARVGPERSGPCRPRRNADKCPHGVSRSCMLRHGPDDPVLGEPLCPSCFDYEGAVLWNAHLGQLWQRTTVLLVRHLARAGAMSERALRGAVRLSYVKVAEFQRRGLVHVHVVLRADGPEGPGSGPPRWVTPELLAGVVRSATSAAGVSGVGGTATVRWGAQGGATVIGAPVSGHRIPATAADEAPVDAAGVAAYVAKYATKGSESSGGLARRLGPSRSSPPAGSAPTSPGWSRRPGPSAPGPGSRRSACGPTPTPSATPGTSPPRAVVTRPPSAPYGPPGRAITSTPASGNPSGAMRAGATRATRPPRWPKRSLGPRRGYPGDVPGTVPALSTRENAPEEFLVRGTPGTAPGSRAGTVAWRDEAMTNPWIFDRLETHLALRSRGAAGRSAMARLAAGIETNGAGDPLELALGCHKPSCHQPGAGGSASVTVSGLIALARGDEVALLCVLVALRPALVKMARRLERSGTPGPEAASVVLAAATEAILTRRAVTAREVVAGTWTIARSTARRERRFAERHRPTAELPDVADVVEHGASTGERVPAVLEEAVARGVLSGSDAVLVHQTRVLGRPLVAVARAQGTTRAALDSSRRRAEGSLRSMLVGQGEGRCA